jgi:hypothetical protein
MKFVSDRVRREWETMTRESRILVPVVLLADLASQEAAGKEIMITSIYRTAEEQALICKGMGVEPYSSVHELWRGADLRSAWYAPDQVAEISRRVNSVFEYGRGFKTAGLHLRGTAAHFHLQVPANSKWGGLV